MGGFFGAVSTRDCVSDVFFCTDYHSHLGTRRGGMAAFGAQHGFQREIHNIENAPFRTKFEGILDEMQGNISIGCISDTDPQPLLVRSALGTYAICTVGVIHNAEALIDELLGDGNACFEAMGGGRVNSNELVAALISRKDTLHGGIQYAQQRVDGTIAVLIMTENALIVGRDRLGRLPIQVGQDGDGFCVSFESFAYQKLGYHDVYALGPGEVLRLDAHGYEQLAAPGAQRKVCAFLWSYYGYPSSNYEGVNVEAMRNRNGAVLARADGALDIDSVSGVPDSGTAHAIGYANTSGIPLARPFIKYTPTWPRSFFPSSQKERNQVAKMKLIPVRELIEGKRLLFVDDSIVRGTQLRETVEFLYENGAREVHIRSACPPVMYGCKFLNFSRRTSELELITRRAILALEGEDGFRYLEEYADKTTQRGKNMREYIRKEMHFTSLEYQTLDGLLEAIGLEPCSVCTYCWSGEE